MNGEASQELVSPAGFHGEASTPSSEKPTSLAEMRDALKTTEFTNRGEIMDMVTDLNTRAAVETGGGKAFALELYNNYSDGLNAVRKIGPATQEDERVIADFLLGGVRRSEEWLMNNGRQDSDKNVTEEQPEENTGLYL